MGDLALKLLMDDGKASASSEVLFPHYCHPQQFCGMHLVAYLGLKDIMVRLLEEKDPQLWPDATVLRRGKGERAGGKAAS